MKADKHIALSIHNCAHSLRQLTRTESNLYITMIPVVKIFEPVLLIAMFSVGNQILNLSKNTSLIRYYSSFAAPRIFSLHQALQIIIHSLDKNINRYCVFGIKTALSQCKLNEYIVWSHNYEYLERNFKRRTIPRTPFDNKLMTSRRVKKQKDSCKIWSIVSKTYMNLFLYTSRDLCAVVLLGLH